MEIGLPKERGARGHDKRAIVLPEEVKEIVSAGHQVYFETGLGEGISAFDENYIKAGAVCVDKPEDAFNRDIVVKLKAVVKDEALMMKPDSIALTMLHQEQSPENGRVLAESECVGVAMEAICDAYGQRYIDCTDITGEQGLLFAYHLFSKSPTECKVLVLGYGRVATGAITIASKLGSEVKILRKGQYKDARHHLEGVDILVNAICWPEENRKAHKHVVTREMLSVMSKPAMIVDLSVDHPSPIETCRPTDMKEPTYEVDGVTHMCIYGYPALASLSSSRRYSKQLLPIILELAEKKLNGLSDPVARAVVDWRG